MDERIGRRVKLNLPLKIIVLNDDHSAASESNGRLHDLSRGGCAFYHRVNLPVGKRVELRIRLNEPLTKKLKKKELRAHGAVIRSVPEAAGYLLSVRFVRQKTG
ncbi:PilZ domain-containing protein [bacterium]|nr:PilZ domain-containing protein [bacterium]